MWYTATLPANRGRIRLLIPRGWRPTRSEEFATGVYPQSTVVIPPKPSFGRLHWLEWLDRAQEKDACIAVVPHEFVHDEDGIAGMLAALSVDDNLNHRARAGFFANMWCAVKDVSTPAGRPYATVFYIRNNKRAFYTTHSGICNSLRME